MKTAAFTVRGTVQQSARWKQAAEAEGHPSVGSWLAGAADAYLKVRAKAGLPLPLVWSRGRFPVHLEEGTVRLPGLVSPPFGIFRGDAAGPGYHGCHTYTLVYALTGTLIATFRYARQCKALASELAPVWLREADRPRADGIMARFQPENL